jgi:5-formyltetrahydrofolate cyclo-ligase
MDSWDQIRQWRQATRAELLSRRLAVPRNRRRAAESACAEHVLQCLRELNPPCIGFYWPFKGEIALNSLIESLLSEGAEAALPVVVEKNAPLEFWAWRPGMALQPGIWKIPVPASRSLRLPELLLVPLLGFDAAGYRLGYGGGYYDRTLARMTPRPRTIGIGYALGRLRSIEPQAHDIPMDFIVTEEGLHRRQQAATRE